MIDGVRQKPLISVAEAAQKLGISATTAYEWARRDELPGLVKLGGRLYVRAAVLARFIDGDDASTSSREATSADQHSRHTRGA